MSIRKLEFPNEGLAQVARLTLIHCGAVRIGSAVVVDVTSLNTTTISDVLQVGRGFFSNTLTDFDKGLL